MLEAAAVEVIVPVDTDNELKEGSPGAELMLPDRGEEETADPDAAVVAEGLEGAVRVLVTWLDIPEEPVPVLVTSAVVVTTSVDTPTLGVPGVPAEVESVAVVEALDVEETVVDEGPVIVRFVIVNSGDALPESPNTTG